MSQALTIAAGDTSTWLETLGEHAALPDEAPHEVHIRLAPDSRLMHYRLLGPHGSPGVTERLTVEVGAGASYEQRMLAAPPAQFRSEQTIRLSGRGATATLKAACVALPQANLDLDITVIHDADDTVSDQRINLLGADRGKATAQVETLVPPGRRGVRADQLLRALQPDGKAVIALRPRLSILSDDVMCRHGATTSAIREDELHYLRSRGIPRDEAVAILSEAFLRQMLPDETQRSAETQGLIEQVLALALRRVPEVAHEA
jgi:ABC-type transport system involved in Fe-S cluster assembly, permease component